MDQTDPVIVFNEQGICQYCLEAEKLLPNYTFSNAQVEENLSHIKHKVLDAKKGKYDCIVGLSGGVDSSYVAYLAVKKLGLNPLAVHFDNGWNSDIAVSNIHNIVEALNLDLETYVVDWEEFRELQKSFLKASVVDVELLTDHAIQAVIENIAKKHRIKYALSGGNYVTEHGLPQSWYWRNKRDKTNIVNIHKAFSKKKLRSFPFLGTLKSKLRHKLGYGLKSIQILNFVNYDKYEALEIIKSELSWKDYGGKHRESTWTKFYQDFYLINKFNIDKRKAHYSALIRNNRISREDAILAISKEPLGETEGKELLQYVLKKLQLSEAEWQKIIASERKEHDSYGSDNDLINKLNGFRSSSAKTNWP